MGEVNKVFCTNCGNKVKDDIAFCPECGAAIKRRPLIVDDDSNDQSKNVGPTNSNEILKYDFDYTRADLSQLGLKWHYALIIYLVFSAVVLFIILINGNRMVPYIPSQYASWYQIFNIFYIILACFNLYVAYELFFFKKNGPKIIQKYFYLCMVLSIVGGIVSAILLILILYFILKYTKKYYQEREGLFVN